MLSFCGREENSTRAAECRNILRPASLEEKTGTVTAGTGSRMAKSYDSEGCPEIPHTVPDVKCFVFAGITDIFQDMSDSSPEDSGILREPVSGEK